MMKFVLISAVLGRVTLLKIQPTCTRVAQDVVDLTSPISNSCLYPHMRVLDHWNASSGLGSVMKRFQLLFPQSTFTTTRTHTATSKPVEIHTGMNNHLSVMELKNLIKPCALQILLCKT